MESKNGSVIRKAYGRNYIDKKWAKAIHEYDRKYFNIYINYHRPCAFAENYTDKKGKRRKKYNQWMTPYEKLKSLEHPKQYLKSEFNFEELNKKAYKESDNEFAKEMNKEKNKLFKKISKDSVYKKVKEKQKNIKNPLEFINLEDEN